VVEESSRLLKILTNLARTRLQAEAGFGRLEEAAGMSPWSRPGHALMLSGASSALAAKIPAATFGYHPTASQNEQSGFLDVF
jgi:hypothetical protein